MGQLIATHRISKIVLQNFMSGSYLNPYPANVEKIVSS